LNNNKKITILFLAEIEMERFKELKEQAMKQKKKEREMILKGLRKIDEQESHVDPRDVLRIRIQSKYLYSFSFNYLFIIF